jgi:acyl-CoA reductase-like NAD-dependent aldehyde dehydrogenase
MELTGANLIAGAERRAGDATYRSVAPETGEEFGPDFHDATEAEVAEAVTAAEAASAVLRSTDRQVLAALLEDIAARLEALGDQLVETAAEETGLGTQRIVGERGRTCGQLRAFARVAAEGSHLDLRIDPADPTTTPPRPDLRRMQVAIGPVAVFGASNFPLAFSVPGGDTASALAAGCSVVAKAHPSHPATSELCGRAIAEAVAAAGLPSGTFSLLHGRDVEVSRALVLAPGIKAVGFTGSERAGRALYDLGAGREEPIPVYAEMGSLNPQFVTARALEERGAEIAEGLVGSFTMGTGQFCTKPGLVFVPATEAGRALERAVADGATEAAPGVLLNEGIHAGLREQLSATAQLDGVDVLADGSGRSPGEGFAAAPTVLAADLDVFLGTPQLAEEHFGPVTVLVRVDASEDLAAVARQLPGALTATVHGTDEDADAVRPLLAELQELAGRVIWNQFPTGVAVAPAMHHGGPYPATTFPAHTSVGTAAIRRFLRPVTYQNTPQPLLPGALRDRNPAGLVRMVNGVLTDAPVS